jgi:molecular chaperone IbpA
MRTYDLNPLWRSTIGFDRLFDLLDETQHRTEDNYPPYTSSGSAKIATRSL